MSFFILTRNKLLKLTKNLHNVKLKEQHDQSGDLPATKENKYLRFWRETVLWLEGKAWNRLKVTRDVSDGTSDALAKGAEIIYLFILF